MDYPYLLHVPPNYFSGTPEYSVNVYDKTCAINEFINDNYGKGGPGINVRGGTGGYVTTRKFLPKF